MKRDIGEVDKDINIRLSEKGEEWIPVLSGHLGFEPTFVLDKAGYPRTLEQIATYHISRDGTPLDEELSDKNTIAVTLIRDRYDIENELANGCFRIDIRVNLEGREVPFYDDQIEDVLLNAGEGSVDFYRGGSETPVLRVFSSGTTTPDLREIAT